MTPPSDCALCGKRLAVSVEGWCRPCLRVKLRERFGPVPIFHHGQLRTTEQRQAREHDPSPSQENAIRAMEDIDDD